MAQRPSSFGPASIASAMPVAVLVASAVASSACVTINVYFPAAEAAKAADKIIDDVWGGTPTPAAPAAVPAERSSSLAVRWVLAVADFVMPVASAAEPNIDVTSAEVKRLSGSMEARFPLLEPLLQSGVLGLTSDGYLAVRDANAVALADRNRVRSLVANENADRAALYREIASANHQPQWEAQIRSVFAARWIARAKSGWYYQDSSGNWMQK